MGWIEVFKTGKHTDSKGREKTFTDADLDKMVESYDPANHEAPLVIGHPKTDSPAYGWVEALRRQGEVLLAKFKQVPDEVKQMVAEGRFKKRSIALYGDGRLRHVGLLGASIPAISGLQDIKSFQGKGDFSEYETGASAPWAAAQEDKDMKELEELKKENEDLRREIKDLKARQKGDEFAEQIKELEAKLKEATDDKSKVKTEFEEYRAAEQTRARETRFDKLVAEGKALPADKKKILTFAESLGKSDSKVEFTQGQGEMTAEEAFWRDLESRKPHSLFGEFATKDAAGDGKGAATATDFDITSKV